MNIKSILSRYALLICFPIVGLSQPTKTLTEPSILPSMTFTIGDRDNDQTDFDHNETLNLVIADYTCEDGGEHPLLQGGGGQSTLGFYRIELSGATQGVLLGESTDSSIDIADTGTTTVTVTPRVKSLLAPSSITECTKKRRLYNFSELYLEVRLSWNDVRKTAYGQTGTPIVYSTEELSSLDGSSLIFTATESDESQAFSISSGASATDIGDTIKTAADAKEVYVHYITNSEEGALLIYVSEGFSISSGSASVEDTEPVRWSLYPKPATTQVHLHTSAEVSYTELYDLRGRAVLTTTSTTIDLKSLSKGLYLVKIYDASHRVLGAQKLIKAY